MLHRRWFPDRIDGSLIVLKRHARDNLPAFMRWYQDPEVARLTRYQDGPMRPDEIERFFMMRALGPDALAMGIHVAATAASKVARTSVTVGSPAGSGAWPTASRTSTTAVATSDERS